MSRTKYSLNGIAKHKYNVPYSKLAPSLKQKIRLIRRSLKKA